MSGTKVIGKATTAEVVNEAMRRLSLAVNPCKVCHEYNCEREGYGDECTNCCFFYASQFKAREDLNLELVKNEN